VWQLRFLFCGHWAKMLYEIAQVCWPFAELRRPGFSFSPYFSHIFFFVIWVAAGRWWCIFIKRLGNCPTGELGVSVSPVSCVFVGQFTHLAFGLVF